jgi:hypothetical protein
MVVMGIVPPLPARRRQCDACGLTYETRSKRSRYWGEPRCRRERERERARRRRGGPLAFFVPLPVPSEALEVGPVEEATRKALEAAGPLSTPIGVSALGLARRLDHSEREKASGFVALAREHRRTVDEVLKNTPPPKDAIDELRERRKRKLIGKRTDGPPNPSPSRPSRLWTPPTSRGRVVCRAPHRFDRGGRASLRNRWQRLAHAHQNGQSVR